MNTNFADAIKAVVAAESKAGNFWKSLVLFVKDEAPKDEDALKTVFSREEQAQTVTKKKLSTFGAYRSAKSVILAALKNDVALMDGEKVRGKTEVEKDVKAAKSETKSEVDKFKASINASALIAAKLETKADLSVAFMLAKALTDKLAEALKVAVA